MVAHEALDRRHSGPRRIVHARGELALHVECQPLLGAADEVVEVDADRPVVVQGAGELLIFVPGEQALVDQLGRRADGEGELPQPEQRLQIAQAPLSLLDIGLDDIAAVPHAAVAFVALGELGDDEFARLPRHDLGTETLAGLVGQLLVTPEEARLEQRRLHAEVVACHPQHVVRGAGRVADLQAEIPEDVEDGLDHLFDPWGRLHRGEEHDVDVGEGRHFGAPEAADGNEGEALGRRRIVARVEMLDRGFRREPQDLFHEEGLGGGEFEAPARSDRDPALHLGAAGLERAAQHRRHVLAAPVGGAVGQRCFDFACHQPPVDQRAAAVDMVIEAVHPDHLGTMAAVA